MVTKKVAIFFTVIGCTCTRTTAYFHLGSLTIESTSFYENYAKNIFAPRTVYGSGKTSSST